MTCAGLLAVGMSAALVGTTFAEPPTVWLLADANMQGSAGNTTKPDKATDMTGGKSGLVEEYADTPVRQGKLQEVRDSKWLQKSVQGPQGETLGKVTQVLKDQKTGDIEYVVLMPNDSKTALPLRWSQFQQKNNDQLQLNMKKEDLKTALNTTSAKDMSPDLEAYMNQLNQVRSEPNIGRSKGSATSAPASVGPMGETQTSHGGASGPQAMPEGKAPGLERGNPSSTR